MVKAKISFCGKVSMNIGEEREIEKEEILNDLLNAGYVEEVGEVKTVKKTKRIVKNEG